MPPTPMVIDDRGRLVVPAEIRERLQWSGGTRLIAIEGDDGIELISRDALQRRVHAQFRSGPSLVDELITERRAEARRDLDG